MKFSQLIEEMASVIKVTSKAELYKELYNALSSGTVKITASYRKVSSVSPKKGKLSESNRIEINIYRSNEVVAVLVPRISGITGSDVWTVIHRLSVDFNIGVDITQDSRGWYMEISS